MNLPKFYLIKQEISTPSIRNIPASVKTELDRIYIQKSIKAGDTVAVTAGSRGIKGIEIIIKTAIDELKRLGARPYIVPAMGSHGAGTDSGQLTVLKHLGITPDTMGCEILSTLEVVEIGKTSLGIPVVMDRFAAEANHIMVINRVKPHTRFTGPVESGLIKMCLIGLGNRKGAHIYHRAVNQYLWQDILESSFELFRRKSKLLCGIAVIQNAHEEICKIKAVSPDDFLDFEKHLLAEAKEIIGRLPFSGIDLLIVDEIGKDISGTGMDTNVIGRKEGSSISIGQIFARDLTDRSDGNALGIGFADFTTKKLVQKIDQDRMYTNARTAYRPDACKIPMAFDTDTQVLEAAMEMAGIESIGQWKIVWIRNTLDLGDMLVSESFYDDIFHTNSVEIESGPHSVLCDPSGNLIRPA